MGCRRSGWRPASFLHRGKGLHPRAGAAAGSQLVREEREELGKLIIPKPSPVGTRHRPDGRLRAPAAKKSLRSNAAAASTTALSPAPAPPPTAADAAAAAIGKRQGGAPPPISQQQLYALEVAGGGGHVVHERRAAEVLHPCQLQPPIRSGLERRPEARMVRPHQAG